MPNVAEIIRGHVTLEVKCVDRLYLNGYVPRLQSSGPRWTPQNRPYVDGAKPAIERAPKRECYVPRFMLIEQVSRECGPWCRQGGLSG